MMIDTDAPEHVRRRRLVSEGFTPRRIRESEEGIRAICDAIIDRVCEAGLGRLRPGHRRPPADDRDRRHAGGGPRGPRRPAALVRRHAEVAGIARPGAMDRAALAAMEYAEYITAVAEQRRRDNQTDDLIGTLVHAEIDGDRLDESSIIYESLLILIGGDETTRHVISGGHVRAAPPSRPAAERWPADRTLLPGGGRGDAAVGLADQEHGPADDPGRRTRTARPCARARSSCCSTRRPTVTSGCSTTRAVRHHPHPQRPHGLRLRLPLLPGQPAGPDGAERHVRPAVRSPARPGSGRGCRAAEAGGQLRVRLRDDAGGVHPHRSGGGAGWREAAASRRRGGDRGAGGSDDGPRWELVAGRLVKMVPVRDFVGALAFVDGWGRWPRRPITTRTSTSATTGDPGPRHPRLRRDHPARSGPGPGDRRVGHGESTDSP